MLASLKSAEFEVAVNPVLSRSKNLESKLIDFLALARSKF